MTDVLRVPETMHLDSLLSELRAGNLQLAVVLDEYGGTAGVATLEDLVEEIVGEVADEHDRVKPGVLQSAAGNWYFPGLMRPDEVTEQIPGCPCPTRPATKRWAASSWPSWAGSPWWGTPSRSTAARWRSSGWTGAGSTGSLHARSVHRCGTAPTPARRVTR